MVRVSVDIPRHPCITLDDGRVLPHHTRYVLAGICIIVIKGDCWAVAEVCILVGALLCWFCVVPLTYSS